MTPRIAHAGVGCPHPRTLVTLGFGLTLVLLPVGCHHGPPATKADKLDRATTMFDIYWPPRDPDAGRAASVKPLLSATMAVDAREQAHGRAEVRVVVTITRRSMEEDRRSWNKTLAYADIAWMSEVRVWDSESKWLWPNLVYLLRLPGQERVERYGGMDPGKHVDNDFAAVLIRAYDADGLIESSATKDAPLVSAEWHAVGAGADTDMFSVVHVAKSDEFVVHVGDARGPARGRLKVWLIYADFLGAKPPRTWPKDPEWAGGILAYFEVDWKTPSGHGCQCVGRHEKPVASTGFDWINWVKRPPGSDASRARVRLSDEAE